MTTIEEVILFLDDEIADYSQQLTDPSAKSDEEYVSELLRHTIFIRDKLKAAEDMARALKPFSECVFYDNGDVTVNFRHISSGELKSAYFALCKWDDKRTDWKLPEGSIKFSEPISREDASDITSQIIGKK